MGSEYKFLGVGVDSRGAVFSLPDGVEVLEDSFDVVFVLEEEGVFDCLS